MIEANGLRFHVQDEGTGTPVVLLHGFPDTHRLWRRQVEGLVPAGYRAIVPDLRGRGASDRPEAVADYALRLAVEDVAAIMDALGIGHAHVVGHDWGAAVAWLLASLMPDRVDRLVALSVGFPGAGGPPDLEALQKGWYRLLFQFEGVAEDLVRRDDWYLMRVLLDSNTDLDDCLRDLSEPEALTAALNWYRANVPVQRLLPSVSGPGLPPVQAPTLGIWSAGDLYLTERSMIRSSDHVRGPWRYVRFDDASHWIPLDQPHRLNALLLEFLGG
jgi:pimeloyl-ACP methyl ester carboxylesterase